MTTNRYFDLIISKLDRWYTSLLIYAPNLVAGLLFFLLVYQLSTKITRIIQEWLHRRYPHKSEFLPTIFGIIRFIVILFGAFISLEILGVSGFLWKFVGSLGVAGVIAGVALKDLVSSIFSGFLVGVDKAFVVGDYITIANTSGTVQEIGFLTTKILTDDGKKVYIPNQTIFAAPFFNVTASPQRRVIIEFQIPAGQDIKKGKDMALKTATSLPFIDRPEDAEALYLDLKGGNFILQIKFWIVPTANFMHSKSEAIIAISEAFSQSKINLVTPTAISVRQEEENSSTNFDS